MNPLNILSFLNKYQPETDELFKGCQQWDAREICLKETKPLPFRNKEALLKNAMTSGIKINKESSANDNKTPKVHELNYQLFKENKRYKEFNKPFDPNHFRSPKGFDTKYQIPIVDHLSSEEIIRLRACLEKFPCGFQPQSINLLHPIHYELSILCKNFIKSNYSSSLEDRIKKYEGILLQIISSTTQNIQIAELLEIGLRTHFFQEMLKQEQLQKNYEFIEKHTNSYDTKSKNLLDFLTKNNKYKIPDEINLIVIRSFKKDANKEAFINFKEKYEKTFYPPLKNKSQPNLNEQKNSNLPPLQQTEQPQDPLPKHTQKNSDYPSKITEVCEEDCINIINYDNDHDFTTPFFTSSNDCKEQDQNKELTLTIPPLLSNHEVVVLDEGFDVDDPNIPLCSYIDLVFGEIFNQKPDQEIWGSLPKIVQRDALRHYNAYGRSSQGKVEDVISRIFEGKIKQERENLERSLKNHKPKNSLLLEGEQFLDHYYSHGGNLTTKLHQWIRQLDNNGPLKALFFQSIYEVAKSLKIRNVDKDFQFAEKNWHNLPLFVSIQAMEKTLHASHFITLHYPEANKDTALFIRGTGSEMSWDKGIQLESLGNGVFAYKTDPTAGPFEFKVLIGDDNNHWSKGDNLKFEGKAIKTQISF